MPYGQVKVVLFWSSGWINEGQWEVIFPGSFVKHPVVDAHSLTSNGPLRYELISLVLDHYHASLLWDYLNRANPFTILHGVYDTCVQ